MDTVHIESVGEGRPVLVLLHPTPTDSSIWVHQLARFSDTHRIMVLDLPGYGRSAPLGPGESLADVARAVWTGLDAHAVGDAVLIGVSAGSTVAQHMAAQQPARTRALVLTGGGYFGSGDTRFETAVRSNIRQFRERGRAMQVGKFREAFRPGAVDDEFLQYLTRILASRTEWLDVEGVISLYERLLDAVPADLLQAISCPTLVISGGRDPGHEAHRELARRIRGARFATIPGAGHLCQVEQPARYDSLLAAFLQRVDGSVGSRATRDATASVPGAQAQKPRARLGHGAANMAFIDVDDPIGYWHYELIHASTWFETSAIAAVDALDRVAQPTLDAIARQAWTAVGSGPTILVSNAENAGLLAAMARREPWRTIGIVLAGEPHGREATVLGHRRSRFCLTFARSARGRYVTSILRDHAEARAADRRGRTVRRLVAKADVRGALATLTCPLEIVVIGSTGTRPQLERPAAFAAAVESFAARLGIVSAEPIRPTQSVSS